MANGRPERSRTSQPATSGLAHSTSSSSASSTRAERVTRSNNPRQQSSNKSSTPHSLSSEDGDEAALQQSEPPLTRRRTRQQDNEGNAATKAEGDGDDEVAEEEEVTRCLCGQQEYPGLPSDAAKSRDGHTHSATMGDPANDDTGLLFIQCDVCQVWQHGGCVGIMEEAASPDEYFCEQCRPEFHKISKSYTGQKYSSYLPVQKKPLPKTSHRKASIPKDSDEKPSRGGDRASAAAEALKKRRSTMNSRAAVDDEEVLREVIEESRTEVAVAGTEGEGSQRKAKRGRDESEDVKQETKRMRTSSRSPASSPAPESDDENGASKTATKAKPRGAAAKSQREKELRDRERERAKEEAANKRKGRAERRRADEAAEDASTNADDTAQPTDAADLVAPDTPQLAAQTVSSKKTGRPPQKRVQRSGKNQYTRDNPTPNNNAASPRDDPSPSSPSARNAGSDTAPGTDAQSKQAKLRTAKMDKATWTNARREAAAMLNYISRRQVELAERNNSNSNGNGNGNGTIITAKTNGVDEGKGGAEKSEVEFKGLSSVEMMDHLTRDITLWQERTKDF